MDPPTPRQPSSCGSRSDDQDDWELISSHSHPNSLDADLNTPSSSSSPPPRLPQLDLPTTPLLQVPTAQDGFEVAAPPGSSSARLAPDTPTVVRRQDRAAVAITMPGWKDDYLASILEVERNNPVNLDLVEACSHMSDKIALLEAEKAQAAHLQIQPQSTPTPSSTPAATPTPSTPAADPDATLAAAATSTDPLILRLRADLAHTLRQNTSLTARLRTATSERDRLATVTKAQHKQIASLTAERDAAARRVRDQAEELQGKKDMLGQMQDEVLALEMQLNIAEQQKTKIAAENKNLIDRWMSRMESEAREMNLRNERGS